MAGIKRFEDIEAWQAARELMWMVYGLSTRGGFAKDYQTYAQAVKTKGLIGGFIRYLEGEIQEQTADIGRWT
jgi:hypothetical protein